jgi:hypothetical protein
MKPTTEEVREFVEKRQKEHGELKINHDTGSDEYWLLIGKIDEANYILGFIDGKDNEDGV